MWRSALKMAAATAVFAVVHSALASRKAKRIAARLLGERRRNAFYRGFYNAQALVTFAMLGLYARSLPDRTLYEVHGPTRWLMQSGRLASFALAVHTARQVGPLRMIGITQMREWTVNAPIVHPEPEAQGPAITPDGRMKVTGAFRYSRHPLNFAPIPIFLLRPKMTVRLAAFTTASFAYFLLGSVHEEARLLAEYGEPYDAYRQSGVSFYLPSAPVDEAALFSEDDVDRARFGDDPTEASVA